jgi:hypothetical protein
LTDGQYVLEAGSAHGITSGARFDVYASDKITSEDVPLGSLRSQTVHAFTTEMLLGSPSSTPFVIPGYVGRALQITAGEEESLRLHVPLEEDYRTVFAALALELSRRQAGQRAILFVDKDSADLSIALNDKHEFEFLVTSDLITGYGLRRLYYTVERDINKIYPIIKGAAHYYWHLRRSPEKNTLRKKVDIEFNRLEPTGEFDDELEDILEPAGENLIQNGVVDIEADKITPYGLTIRNKVNVPLYIALFFFDNSDLSIGKLLYRNTPYVKLILS